MHPWERFGDKPYTYDITIDDFRAVTQKDVTDYTDFIIAYVRIIEFVDSKRGMKNYAPIVKFVDAERAALKERVSKNAL